MRVRLAKRRLDQLMYMSPAANRTWQPAHALDLPFGWDQKYLARYGQPFSPFAFARNASMVLGAAERGHRSPLLSAVAAHLDEVASRYTHSLDGHLVVVHDFDYENLWTRFQGGFFGALQNALTAFGYIHLYEAVGASTYLDRARALLLAIIEWKQHPLSCVDEDGQFWLYEYVFRVPPEDDWYVEQIGLVKGSDQHYRASVINGHLLSLIALARYEATTKSAEFSMAIEAASSTMKSILPRQLYRNRYFSLMKQYPLVPDYGQERAVRLARGLAEMYPDDQQLAATVATMDAFYQRSVVGRDDEIVAAGLREARRVSAFVKAVAADRAGGAGGSVAP